MMSFSMVGCLRPMAIVFVSCIAVATCKPSVGSDDAKNACHFYKTGTATPQEFNGVASSQVFDVVNAGSSYMMLVFERNPDATFSPGIVRLGPNGRQKVTMTVRDGVSALTVPYAVSSATTPFKTHANRYRAYDDGETVLCVPVDPKLQQSMKERADDIFRCSKALITEKDWPAGTYIYTPGETYRRAGVFGRDFLYQLEGGGRDTVTADEVRHAVDFIASKQLKENRVVGGLTFPKGAVPDHVYPDGRYCWGPGDFYGDVNAHFNRPSMDEAACFVILAWHYGYKADWDAKWQTWFNAHTQNFIDAWNSFPRNPQTGLVTQWTTKGHIGAAGVEETNAASVMWGFHDSYGLPGDDLGVSVLACNAARALADMYDHVSDSSSAKTWSATADAMRDSIRAQFQPDGYLPWGVGHADAPTMASPDITGYAVWSGILTDQQADAASDWFAKCYAADKKAGGAADLFHMKPGCRGTVRMARRIDDRYPGSHVWPHVGPPHWENLALGYNAYQDGGYWYYMSLGVAKTLWRKHPGEAKQWVADAYADIAASDIHHPYERFDGDLPGNDRYNASASALLGMGMPAESFTITASMETTP